MPTYNHPIVGPVRFEAKGGGKIQLLDNWEAQNITTVFIPELKDVKTYNGYFSGNVRFYRRAAAQLKAAFAEIGRQGLAKDVIFWDGSFVPRMKRGSSISPSNHSFGTAFDINADWNPFQRPVAAPGEKGSVWQLVPIFKRFGFVWGGNWKIKDGMHFEIAKLMDVSSIVSTTGTAAKANPKAAPQSVIMVHQDAEGKWQAERINTFLDKGENWGTVREVLAASGAQIVKEGRWSDGTPALYVKR